MCMKTDRFIRSCVVPSFSFRAIIVLMNNDFASHKYISTALWYPSYTFVSFEAHRTPRHANSCAAQDNAQSKTENCQEPVLNRGKPAQVEISDGCGTIPDNLFRPKSPEHIRCQQPFRLYT